MGDKAKATDGQMSLSEWLAEAEAARITLRPDTHGHVPSASDLVNEVRDERDAQILRSLGYGESADDGTK